MSDFGQQGKPGSLPTASPTVDAAPTAVPRGIEPGEGFGPSRMAHVIEERHAAADDARARMGGESNGPRPLDRIVAQRVQSAHDAIRRVGVQRKAAGAAGAAKIPDGGGAPLAGEVRKRLEPKLGADLSDVKIHTGGESAKAATDLGARAFTVGSEVHFNRGEYDPGSKEGDRLLAHELTHVVQGQKSGVQRKAEPEAPGAEPTAAKEGGAEAEVSQPGEPAEKEADAVADQVADQLHGDQKDEKAGGAKGKSNAKPGKGKKGAAADAADNKESSQGDKGEAQEPGASKPEAAAGSDGPKADAKGDTPPAGGTIEPGEKKGGDAGQEKAPPIAAKLEGVGRKVFRATTPPSPSSPPAAPPDPYLAFVATLPGDLQPKARDLAADVEMKAALQKQGLEFARPFLALATRAARVEFGNLGWNPKSQIGVMALTGDELPLYESFDAAKRAAFRDQLSPDERRDAKKLAPDALTKLLTLPPELQSWRVIRSKAVMGADVAGKLVAAGQSVDDIVNALSSSRGGDRLRRILQDPQLPPGTKAQFMLDVKAKLTTTPDPFEAMKQVQPAYKLLGKDASMDGKFATMEILKAMPIVNFAKYGTVPKPSVVNACLGAPASDVRIPRTPDGSSVDKGKLNEKLDADPELFKQLATQYFPPFGKQGVGNLSGCDTMIAGGKVGPELMPAYWTYDSKAQMTLGMPANDVSKALAVDESPDYQNGGVIVGLPEAVKTAFAAQKQIKRPTAIDGLSFDQFQLVEDPNQCFGITAGGMGEVVVAPIKYSQATPKRTF